jgi:hypothetical protein
MPDGERRKPIDIEFCRTKVKVITSKNRTKIRYFLFVSARYLENESNPIFILFGIVLLYFHFSFYLERNIIINQTKLVHDI